MTDYWANTHKVWDGIGYPLRPDAHVRKAFAELGELDSSGPLDVLILGVTPEIYSLGWPEKSSILGADINLGMIEQVWPGPIQDAVLCDWLNLPFERSTFDRVYLDGGQMFFAQGPEHQKLVDSISRVLRVGGHAILRCFASPENVPEVGEIIAKLHSGEIRNVNYLKLIMGMALSDGPQKGVSVNTIHDLLVDNFGTIDALAKPMGLTREERKSISAYSNSHNRYYFQTSDLLIESFTKQTGLRLSEKVVLNDEYGVSPIFRFSKTR